MYIFLPISKKKENKISIIPLILAESINLCYGLSKNGYDKIDDVIQELKEETEVAKLDINCGQNRLKNGLLNYIGLLLILITM